MHTPLSRLTTIASFGATAVRSQLSPLRRRSTRDTLNARRAAALARSTARVSATPSPRAPAPSVFTDRWWDPHLLDRLQMPLTRYRE